MDTPHPFADAGLDGQRIGLAACRTLGVPKSSKLGLKGGG